MTKQRESRLSGRIIRDINLRGGFAFKTHGSEYQMAGLPDILCCYRGYYFGFETKNPESRDDVSPIQAHVHDRIERSGGRVYVVCGVSEVMEILDNFDRSLEINGIG